VSLRFDTVSFLSDYGRSDEFVGVVTSVIVDMAPGVRVIDLTHDVAPFDVRAGSLALARAIPYVPRGVVLAVVDPGVGTSRRCIAVEVAGGEGVFVGPDNGLLAAGVALTGGAERAVSLDRVEFHLESPGATFAGRDVFAPVVARLCLGVDLAELGTLIDPAGILPGVVPLPREESGALIVEVTWVDRFGNCQLNVSPEDVASWGRVVRVVLDDPVGGQPLVRAVPVVSTFAEIGTGLGLVVDSCGMLALAADRRSAAAELGLGAGTGVRLEPGGSSDGVDVRLGPPRVRE